MPKDEGSPDLVIVSMHERGFPQADFYQGAATMDPDEFRCCGMSPDAFFTLSTGQSLVDAKAQAEKDWPGAVIVDGVSDDEFNDDETED